MEWTRKNQIAAIDAHMECTGIAQRALERLSGVPYDTIKDLRRGKRSMASDKWQKIEAFIFNNNTEKNNGLAQGEAAICAVLLQIIELLLPTHKLIKGKLHERINVLRVQYEAQGDNIAAYLLLQLMESLDKSDDAKTLPSPSWLTPPDQYKSEGITSLQ